MELRLDRYELKAIVNELNLRVGGSICTAGISRFRITPYGDVNPCEMLRHISLGNIKDSSFKEIISSSNALKWHNQFNDVMNNKCFGCEKKINV
ncbi:SPASM domain-containing protein [Paraclostridium sp. AKS46]|nr:SPASM domain-containing protein [Paraclostridium sp. AKS46]